MHLTNLNALITSNDTHALQVSDSVANNQTWYLHKLKAHDQLIHCDDLLVPAGSVKQ